MIPRRVGLVVNPIAGMGARVGLKGTDAVVDEARRRGARPVAHERALAFLRALRSEPEWVTAAGAMGEDALAEAGQSAMVVHAPASEATSAEDTREAVAAVAASGVDVLVFVGGDGTAADVAAGLERLTREAAPGGAAGAPDRLPVLGVPSGSKMYSPVFAETPLAVARVLDDGFDDARPTDVLDIDEDAFRRGELRVALKGRLFVPAHRVVQAGKLAGADDEVEQATLARAVADSFESGVTYVLGAGSTMEEVKRAVGVDGTLLGIDAVRDGRLVARDAAEADLLALPEPLVIVVSPIGHQGFFLGRGNLPISPAVVRKAGGPANVIVVATPSKLVDTPALKTDSGDAGLDAEFPRFLRVVTGFNQTKLVRVSRA